MEKTIAFVKDVLGCGCSDDVFEHIVVDKDFNAGDGLTLDHRLNIGNKLLVYIYHPNDSGDARACLPRLFTAGLKERDEKGFNRIRVVIASDDNAIKQAAYLAFKKVTLPDDRAHLHILDKKAIDIE